MNAERVRWSSLWHLLQAVPREHPFVCCRAVVGPGTPPRRFAVVPAVCEHRPIV